MRFFLFVILITTLNFPIWGQSESTGTDKTQKYKLVFASSYEGTTNFEGSTELKTKQYADSIEAERLNFLKELNNHGKQGYKVISVLPSLPLAMVIRDEAEYEYDLFDTVSDVFFSKRGLIEKLIKTSDNGFRLVDHSLIYFRCDWKVPDPDRVNIEQCEYQDRYLVEKITNSNKKPVDQLLIYTMPRWGGKTNSLLEAQIDEKMQTGYYPFKAISKFEVLLQRAENTNEFINNKFQTEYIAETYEGSGVKQKTNKLAAQGYRMAAANYKITVMYKNAQTAGTPTLYTWVETKKKGFEKNIARLEQQGAVYRMTYPNVWGQKSALIFEQKLKDDGERREYKILKINLARTEKIDEQKVYVDLSPESKKNLELLNSLAEQGFVVRDLFYSGEINIILEKLK